MNKQITPNNPFIEFSEVKPSDTIVQRFEQQVRQSPQRIAIKTTTVQLSYADLNSAANQLARTISAQATDNSTPIPLLFSSAEKRLIAQLGVLKAGKAWVPLDPEQPAKHLNGILADIQAYYGLTDTENMPLTSSLQQDGCYWLNTDKIDFSLAIDNLRLPIQGDALANVLYTSGSTGQAKGVMHSHNNVLNFVRTHTNTMHISQNDRILQLSSYMHMAGLTATFRAVLNGATLYPFDVKKEGLLKLVAWLEEQAITTYQSVPTLFRHIVKHLHSVHSLPHLRLIHLAGERMSRHDIRLYQTWFAPPCLLLNNLGATEVSTYRSYFINHKTKITEGMVPAGYALEDKEVLLFDEQGHLINGQGVGQIAVRSAHLALGYWQKEELNTQVFLNDTKDCNKRIYLTGDLGLMRPDGCLEYHGRIDSQVKIRGMRVELAEIELALLNHNDIQEAVVNTYTDQNDEIKLIAYITTEKQTGLSIGNIHSFLYPKLPRYMLPTDLVLLETMPLTATGKIDRKTLHQQYKGPVTVNQSAMNKGPAAKKIRPRNSLEIHLVKLWEQLLAYEPIGIYDDFLSLGGDSLLAVRLLDEVEKKFGKKLPLDILWYGSPTIAHMAQVLNTDIHPFTPPKQVTIKKVSREKITSAQQSENIPG